jgi:hypothetical protein
MLQYNGVFVMSFEQILMVDWHGLKRMGWPYSKAQTQRLEESKILRSSGSRRKGNFKEWYEPNLKPFPRRVKFGEFRNSHPVWPYADVIAYFKDHGLKVTDD